MVVYGRMVIQNRTAEYEHWATCHFEKATMITAVVIIGLCYSMHPWNEFSGLYPITASDWRDMKMRCRPNGGLL